MPLKLYGFTLSSCTRRVAVVCKELDVPYELVSVDILKGEQRSPEHLARQPFGLVPTIEVHPPSFSWNFFTHLLAMYITQDDTLSLFESRAIGRYLVAKYGPVTGSTLVPDPSDIAATAKFEQAMSIENNYFDPTGRQLAFELLLKPLLGMQTDKAQVKELVVTMEGRLDVYDKILGTQKYLAGDVSSLSVDVVTRHSPLAPNADSDTRGPLPPPLGVCTD
jgi:glutathione S-transferase